MRRSLFDTAVVVEHDSREAEPGHVAVAERRTAEASRLQSSVGVLSGRGWWRYGFRTARIKQRSAKHELDLPVQAPQIIVRPALQRFEHGTVDPKKKRLAICHEPCGR